MGKPRRGAGFTLIEIAIVLVVLGLLLAGLIGPMGTRIEQEERERTRAILEEIKEALYGFAIAQGRLPCPDSDGDGREDPTGGGCASGAPNDVVGNLPWVDLAVPEEDAWGRRFRYRVTPSYADDVSADTVTPAPPGTPCTAVPPTLPAQASFALCSDGDITIRSNGVGTSPTTLVATKVAAVVISHGKHRFLPGDASPHEDENFDDSSPGDDPGTIVSRDYTGGTGEEFDDLVVWIPHLILKNRMIMAGKLP
ncbi:MAG: prepilin-type N-terminal cleavage/methylation domain-containing protein [Gammaproteobacteria bacterium]